MENQNYRIKLLIKLTDIEGNKNLGIFLNNLKKK